MGFFFDFIALYVQHFSAIDLLIVSLGIATLGFQLQEWRFLSANQALINNPFQHAQKRAYRVVRIATLAIDGFPLLGLLGTVASLLVTFAGIKGNHVTSNIIADFAPGLTSTVSGLLCSLANLVFLQLCLAPAVEVFRRKRSHNG
ncbi:MotA/TolQ/ExbB proton channel family protein [Planctomycetes bacterium CA13]|uniref:MotA/TolQ/ExbB proton channel family protein n=1 Tax=Novipirellula herctigrandis TaxID=2527986 RepID=A0A5C5Z227_9BACT|nr:MotA/TolQ/ExbB proton channel family protein [Planctomycetes bacterium CA13]